MNELITTTVTLSADEVLFALKLAYPDNLRINAMPHAGRTNQGFDLSAYGVNGIQLKWTRDAARAV